jgi:hypothetical protein
MTIARYTPGSLIAVVGPAGAALLPQGTSVDVAEAVWQRLRDGSGLGGLLDVLAAGGPLSAVPPFALALHDDGAWRVAVRGGFAVAGVDETVDGAGATTWSERTLRTGDTITLAAAGGADRDGGPARPLRDGVVAAGSLTMTGEGVGRTPADAPARSAALAAPSEPVQPHSIREVHDLPATSPDADAADADTPDEPDTDADAPDGPGTDADAADGPGTDADAPGAPAADAPAEASDAEAAATGLIDAVPVVPAPAPPIPAPPAPAPSTPAPPAAAPVPAAGPAATEVLPVASTGDGALPGLADEVEATVIRGAGPAASAPADEDDETISLAEARALRAAGALPPVAPPLAPAAPPSAAGVLRVSNGASVLLDRTVIIGRRPRSTRVSGPELPHLIAVDSPQQDISRNHVEIRVEGDTILATDLQTTNGTRLLRAGAEPVRLHPAEATMVVVGDVLDLGDGITVAVEAAP